MKKYLVLIAAIAAIASSCGEHTYTPEFLTDDTIRLENSRETVLIYDPNTCQYSYNVQRCEFRCHKDNMSDWFFIDLISMPEAEKTTVTASRLEWTTPKGMNQVRKNISFEVVKLDGTRIWLWNSGESIKIALRFD